MTPNSINSWNDLECKFHKHFFSREYELGLPDLALVRQGREEWVNDYIWRFQDTRNWCFRIHVTDKELAGLAFNGLLFYLRDKVDGTQLFSIAQLHQRAFAYESRCKDTSKSVAHTIHLVERDTSYDESANVYTVELVWPMKAKSSMCSSLQSVQKNRQEVKFTFNVAKCDKIFGELVKNRNIKSTHNIPPMDELKRRPYCEWHNSFSHATNDCNIFRQQIQSTINKGRLVFQEMQVDTQSFPINTIELTSKKVLVRPKMTNKSKCKSIIIGDPHTLNISQGGITRKAPDKKTNMSEGDEEQAQLSSRAWIPNSSIADGPAPARGQFGAHAHSPADSSGQSAHGQRRQPPYKAKNDTQEQSTYKTHGRLVKVDLTFDQLHSKNASKKTILRDRPTKKLQSRAKTKRPKRQCNKHRLFIPWCQDTFHPPTHRRSIVLFKYRTVRRWTRGTCIVLLSIQAGWRLHSIDFDPLIR